MNCCFLTEDSKSLLTVLPYWLKYLNFPCDRVANNSDLTHNTYTALSGYGCYQLISHKLYDVMKEIINGNYNLDYLFVMIDSENMSVSERVQEVQNALVLFENRDKINFEIKIIVIKRCFETWLLGNSKLFPETSPKKESSFFEYYNFFNVSLNDPENMMKPINFNKSIAKYHAQYFSCLCQFNNLRYTKKNPSMVTSKEFFEQLLLRIRTTNHLKSFKIFVNYIEEIL